MARNVEIKARVRDIDTVEQLAAGLSAGSPQVMVKEDTFFHSTHGRLKLRQLAQDVGELIYYDRLDVTGSKTSTYSISYTNNPAQLRAVLSCALGEKSKVIKVRKVYLVGPTCIHLDQVEGLGEFVELEVVLADGETEKSGESTALDLMEKLGIKKRDLIEGAYADLLPKNAP